MTWIENVCIYYCDMGDGGCGDKAPYFYDRYCFFWGGSMIVFFIKMRFFLKIDKNKNHYQLCLHAYLPKNDLSRIPLDTYKWWWLLLLFIIIIVPNI